MPNICYSQKTCKFAVLLCYIFVDMKNQTLPVLSRKFSATQTIKQSEKKMASMGTQNTISVFAKYLTGVITRSRKQDAICSKWNGMYENNINVMVREAFLFMVTVYSKHFPSIKKTFP